MIESNITAVSKIIDIIVFFMILLSQRIKKKVFHFISHLRCGVKMLCLTVTLNDYSLYGSANNFMFLCFQYLEIVIFNYKK